MLVYLLNTTNSLIGKQYAVTRVMVHAPPLLHITHHSCQKRWHWPPHRWHCRNHYSLKCASCRNCIYKYMPWGLIYQSLALFPNILETHKRWVEQHKLNVCCRSRHIPIVGKKPYSQTEYNFICVFRSAMEADFLNLFLPFGRFDKFRVIPPVWFFEKNCTQNRQSLNQKSCRDTLPTEYIFNLRRSFSSCELVEWNPNETHLHFIFQ